MYLNKVILCGKICNDPIVRFTQKNVPVTNFTLKTVDSWKHQPTGDFRHSVKYHKIVCWGSLAKMASEDINKDDIVLLEGELSYHKYEKTLNTGEPIEIMNTEIKVTKLQKYNNGDDDAGYTENKA